MKGVLSMKKKMIIIVAVLVFLLGIGGVCAGFAWKDYNRFEVKQEKVTIELGEKISKLPEDYIVASEKVLTETELDTSNVDTMKVGTYVIHATWKKHSADITVVVKDTVAPEVTLKENDVLSVMVGQEIKSTDLIEKVDDLAGIKTVSFDKNQIEFATDSGNPLEKIGLKFDTAGEQDVTFIAEDNNGNKTEKEIHVKVIEDYLSHVNGFHDIATEQGSKPDWMEGIVADDKIAGITIDESAVDINTPGEYQLKYIIAGNDGETIVEQTVKVTVTEKVAVQETPEKDNESNKNSSQNSRNNNTRSSDGRRSGENTSTGGAGGSSSGGNREESSEESNWLDSLNPGDTWVSEDEAGGVSENTGINGVSGSW